MIITKEYLIEVLKIVYSDPNITDDYINENIVRAENSINYLLDGSITTQEQFDALPPEVQIHIENAIGYLSDYWITKNIFNEGESTSASTGSLSYSQTNSRSANFVPQIVKDELENSGLFVRQALLSAGYEDQDSQQLEITQEGDQLYIFYGGRKMITYNQAQTLIKAELAKKVVIEGPIGPIGPRGLQGPTGSIGPQGIAGLRGETGQTGRSGTSTINPQVNLNKTDINTNKVAIADNKTKITELENRPTGTGTGVEIDPFETVDQTIYTGRFPYNNFEQYSTLEWLPLTTINQIQGDLYYGSRNISLIIDENSHLLPEHFDLETGRIIITDENIGDLAHKLYGFILNKSIIKFINQVPDFIEIAWARWPTTQGTWIGGPVSEIEGFEILFPLTLDGGYVAGAEVLYGVSSDQEFEFSAGYTYNPVIKNGHWHDINRRARGDGFIEYEIRITNVNDFSDSPKTSDLRTTDDDNQLGNTQAQTNKKLILKTQHNYDNGEIPAQHVQYGAGATKTDVASTLDSLKRVIESLSFRGDSLTPEQLQKLQNLDSEGKLDYENIKNHPTIGLTQEQLNQIQNLDSEGKLDYENIKNHPAIGEGGGAAVSADLPMKKIEDFPTPTGTYKQYQYSAYTLGDTWNLEDTIYTGSNLNSGPRLEKTQEILRGFGYDDLPDNYYTGNNKFYIIVKHVSPDIQTIEITFVSLNDGHYHPLKLYRATAKALTSQLVRFYWAGYFTEITTQMEEGITPIGYDITGMSGTEAFDFLTAMPQVLGELVYWTEDPHKTKWSYQITNIANTLTDKRIFARATAYQTDSSLRPEYLYEDQLIVDGINNRVSLYEGQRIKVDDPSQPQDIANKKYVDDNAGDTTRYEPFNNLSFYEDEPFQIRKHNESLDPYHTATTQTRFGIRNVETKFDKGGEIGWTVKFDIYLKNPANFLDRLDYLYLWSIFSFPEHAEDWDKEQFLVEGHMNFNTGLPRPVTINTMNFQYNSGSSQARDAHYHTIASTSSSVSLQVNRLDAYLRDNENLTCLVYIKLHHPKELSWNE